jgi:hypothetical protein
MYIPLTLRCLGAAKASKGCLTSQDASRLALARERLSMEGSEETLIRPSGTFSHLLRKQAKAIITKTCITSR